VGKPDRVKGESIVVFAVLKQDANGDANLQRDIKNFVRKTLGHIAIPSDVIFVGDIPRNKAGKPVLHEAGSIANLYHMKLLSCGEKHGRYN
jgi:acetyl-CoA synthetase